LRNPSRVKRKGFMKRICFSLTYALFLFNPSLSSQPTQAVAAATPPEASKWFVDLNRFSESAHRNFACETCHGDMSEDGKLHPDTRDTADLEREATRIYDYRRCAVCHRESHERYLQGAHAKALAEEKRAVRSGGPDSEGLKAPTCGECHSAHYGRSHLSRVAIGKEMTGVCGTCHPAQKATYLENYHGKIGVHLSEEASAYCTDCHGAHTCVSLKDGKTALKACQRCHPDAGERFTQFVIHPAIDELSKDNEEKQRHVAIIKAVSLMMTVIVILVVGFFYGHSFLWLLREIHERLRKH